MCIHEGGADLKLGSPGVFVLLNQFLDRKLLFLRTLYRLLGLKGVKEFRHPATRILLLEDCLSTLGPCAATILEHQGVLLEC